MSIQAAQRYANALYESAEACQATAVVGADFRAITTLIDENKDFAAFLQNPVLPREKQSAVIDAAFTDKVHPFTLKCIHFLIDKGRLSILKLVCEKFESLFLHGQGIARVEITSSGPLDDHQKGALKKYFREKLGKDIHANMSVDPRMIGGIKVRMGDEIHDYTLKAQLEAFRQTALGTS